MKVQYETRYASSQQVVKEYNTQQLRNEFLIENFMQEDQLVLVYSHFHRYRAGSAVFIAPIKLETIEPLKSSYFLERRELGILNVGGVGSIEIDNKIFNLTLKDAYTLEEVIRKLYSKVWIKKPAKFYLNLAPAHRIYPTKKVRKAEASKLEIGSLDTANYRTVNQMIIGGIVDTCQLQMI